MATDLAVQKELIHTQAVAPAKREGHSETHQKAAQGLKWNEMVLFQFG